MLKGIIDRFFKTNRGDAADIGPPIKYIYAEIPLEHFDNYEIGDYGRLARMSDPITSHEAADAIAPSIPWMQRRVLRFAAERGLAGFTDREMEFAFNNDGSSYRTRRAELAEIGMIANSGTFRREDGEPRRRIVWMITRKGAAALAVKQ